MIGRLTGVVVAESLDGSVVLDVAGVGYEVATALGTVGRARALADGERITLHVHTHVREDALALFGFATGDDREAFRTLISLSSVGPRTALAVLGVLPAEDLARVVASKDRARLEAIPGIGKKTAERLLFDLADKLTAPKGVATAPAGVRAPAGPSQAERLGGALAHMGFKPAEVERAVTALRPKLAEERLEVLLREALALLSR